MEIVVLLMVVTVEPILHREAGGDRINGEAEAAETHCDNM